MACGSAGGSAEIDVQCEVPGAGAVLGQADHHQAHRLKQPNDGPASRGHVPVKEEVPEVPPERRKALS